MTTAKESYTLDQTHAAAKRLISDAEERLEKAVSAEDYEVAASLSAYIRGMKQIALLYGAIVPEEEE